jgi:putative PIN family toxin of toxin-antitoxin system
MGCDTRPRRAMNPIQIVIDTNVVVSALRSRHGASYALLHGLGDHRWQLNLSTTLALEYETALKREMKNQNRPLSLAEETVDALITVANRTSIQCRYRPVLPDPSDDFVLELAVESGAAYVVTYNIRDFKGLEHYGISAIRPGEFLRILEGCT